MFFVVHFSVGLSELLRTGRMRFTVRNCEAIHTEDRNLVRRGDWNGDLGGEMEAVACSEVCRGSRLLPSDVHLPLPVFVSHPVSQSRLSLDDFHVPGPVSLQTEYKRGPFPDEARSLTLP